MSATSGIGDFFTISLIASAALGLRTANLAISQPAKANSLIWFKVDYTSLVSVLHIDCTLIGASPPIFTSPMLITFDFLLFIIKLL